jgi:hypothetical protein
VADELMLPNYPRDPRSNSGCGGAALGNPRLFSLFRVTSPQIWDSTPVKSHNPNQSTKRTDMNQPPKVEKKPKTKSKIQIPDLKPKKDPKAGIIAVLIGLTPTTSSK